MVKLGLWGNHSLALRLPSHIVRAASLRPGLTVTLRLMDDGTIRVKPVGPTALARAAAGNTQAPMENESTARSPVQW